MLPIRDSRVALREAPPSLLSFFPLLGSAMSTPPAWSFTSHLLPGKKSTLPALPLSRPVRRPLCSEPQVQPPASGSSLPVVAPALDPGGRQVGEGLQQSR